MARGQRHRCPHAELMGVIGVAAPLANGAVAAMLFAYRSGESNMRSIWLCSRNDVIGNVAVLLAAAGVFGTGTGWPGLRWHWSWRGSASPERPRSLGRPCQS